MIERTIPNTAWCQRLVFLDVKLPLPALPHPALCHPTLHHLAPPCVASPSVTPSCVAPPSRISWTHVRASLTVTSADMGFLAATCGDRISFKALVSSTEPTEPISRREPWLTIPIILDDTDGLLDNCRAVQRLICCSQFYRASTTFPLRSELSRVSIDLTRWLLKTSSSERSIRADHPDSDRFRSKWSEKYLSWRHKSERKWPATAAGGGRFAANRKWATFSCNVTHDSVAERWSYVLYANKYMLHGVCMCGHAHGSFMSAYSRAASERIICKPTRFIRVPQNHFFYLSFIHLTRKHENKLIDVLAHLCPHVT